MSEPDGPDDAASRPDVQVVTEGATEGMYLAKLISDAVAARSTRGAPWLAENAIDPDTGETVFTRQSAYMLMNRPKKGSLDPDQKRGICAALGWSEDFIHQADGINQGLRLRRGGTSAFAATIPPEVDDLPERRKRLYRDLLIAAVEDHQAKND
jgi:hypothetical protein